MKNISLTLKTFSLLFFFFLLFFTSTHDFSIRRNLSEKVIKVTHAQLEYGEEFKIHPLLDYVAINNSIVKVGSNGIVEVVTGDAVKISGRGNILSNVRVTISDKTYETTVDEYGNWYVLFSMLDFPQNLIPVNVDLVNENGERESIALLSLLIVDYEERVDKDLGESEDKDNSNIRIYVGAFLLVLLSGGGGWLLGYTMRGKKK